MIKKIFIFAFVSLFFVNFALAQGEAKKEQEYIGEFFGATVPIGNYYFVKGVIMVFGNTSSPKPQTPQELEDCVWYSTPGYGVFMVLEKRIADESKYPQLKESYYEQIKAKKRYEGLKEWIKKLKHDANIKIYPIKKE